MTVRVAVVGAGRQGRNHLRSFSRLLTCAVTAVVDIDAEAAKAAAEPFGARSAGELGAVLDDCDAVVVAVPSEHHLDTTRTAMAAGKHVLVEKPIGATLGEAAEFVALAAAHPKIVTMVGHVERFNPVVRTLLAGEVKPIAAHFERVSPYTPRIAESVVNDLLIHDADIALRLFGVPFGAVSAQSVAKHSATHDMATAIVEFGSGFAVFTVSRLGQQKIRRVQITAESDFIVADLLRQELSYTHTERSFFDARGSGSYSEVNQVAIPFIDGKGGEPLLAEAAEFIDAIVEQRPASVTFLHALDAMKLVDAVLRALDG